MSDYIINTNPTFIQNESRKKDDSSKVNQFDEKVYLDVRLAPNETTRTIFIRILPISHDCGDLWAQTKVHNLKVDKKIARSGFKSYTCLNKSKEDRVCPICAKGSQIWKEAQEAKKAGNLELAKELEKKAKKHFAKDAYIVRCIERGKENEGVKFWRFYGSVKGDGMYDQLIALSNSLTEEMSANGRPGYNMFDLTNGRDIKLILTEGISNTGERITNVSVQVAMFESPLSQDINQANVWLSDPKTWKDVYTTKTPDYLSIVIDGKIPVRDKQTGAYTAMTITEGTNGSNDTQLPPPVMQPHTPIANGQYVQPMQVNPSTQMYQQTPVEEQRNRFAYAQPTPSQTNGGNNTSGNLPF